MNKIQVFIATYNRPKLLKETLQSVLQQDYENYDIIISDNSNNDETEYLINKLNNKRLYYIKRNPSLSPINHFNAILQNVTAEFFMIFHDDDLMLPNMLSTLMNHFEDNVVAVGANALLMKNNVITKTFFRKKMHSNITIYNSQELAILYAIGNRTVPFPSYLYKNIVAKKNILDIKKGGKYSDAAFIVDVCLLGKIIHIKNPLMIYNIHINQDSQNHKFLEKIKLINYFINTIKIRRKNKHIIRYRINNIYLEFCNILRNNLLPFYKQRLLRILLIIIKYKDLNHFCKLTIRVFQYQKINFFKN